MKEQARIVITTKCNMNCGYCIMKDKATLETFKPITQSDISTIVFNYPRIAITGGEPMLAVDKIFSIIYWKEDWRKFYLYSNGLLISKEFLRKAKNRLSGINIGMHNYQISYEEILRIEEEIPVRLLIWEKEINKDFINFCIKSGIPYKAWKMNDCDNTEYEDRYIWEE